MSAIIDYRGKTPRKTSTGIPLVTAKVVKGGRIATPDEFIAVDDYEPWMRRGLPEPGDVLVTTEAPLGEVAQLDGRQVALAQRLITLRGLPDVLNNTFLKFAMQCEFVQRQLRARSTGTTVLGIRQSELRKVLLPVPPIDEQRAIASILGALDDKIELNRRMNETLEAMARAVYKSWFVDFDPVRAKTGGEEPWGMDAATAPLFPDAFEDSALGEIPQGWQVGTVEAMCQLVTRGVTPKYEQGTGRFIVNQRANRGANLDLGELKELAADLDVPQEKYAQAFDVLVNCLGEGTLGRVHLFADEPGIWAVDQHMSICRAVSPGAALLIYETLSSPNGQERIESLKTGSTGMTMFNISKLRSLSILTPPAILLDAYHREVALMWSLRSANTQQSRTLAELRDTLLPKLLSGEVRVGAAEKMVESAI